MDCVRAVRQQHVSSFDFGLPASRGAGSEDLARWNRLMPLAALPSQSKKRRATLGGNTFSLDLTLPLDLNCS
jgi:hypothetical protein